MREFTEEPLLYLKGALIFAVGPLDYYLAYLLLAMAVDLTFGIQVALKNKDFSWSTLIRKFGKKVKTYALWIIMFHALDKVMGLPNTARWSLIVVLVGIEILSAIKNTSKLGYGKLADELERLYLSLITRRHQKGGSSHDKHVIVRKVKRDEDNDSDSI